MTEADTMSPPGESPAPAAGAELTIPKHRFDELNERLRRAEESARIKDDLYMQERQRQMAPAPQEEEDTEDYGLDPQTHKALAKMASKIAQKEVKKLSQAVSQQIGYIGNRTEKAELLATKGADKAKYLPEIERKQMEHSQRTGQYLPADVALDLLLSDEKDRRIKDLEARLAGKAQAATPPTQVQDPDPAPGAAGTRDIPVGGSTGAPVKKGFSELTWQEQEALLDSQIKAGAQL